MTPLAALHQRCGAEALLVMLPGALMTPQHMVDAGLFGPCSNGGWRST